MITRVILLVDEQVVYHRLVEEANAQTVVDQLHEYVKLESLNQHHQVLIHTVQNLSATTSSHAHFTAPVVAGPYKSFSF